MLAAMDEVGKATTKVRDMEEVTVSSSNKRRKVDDSELLVVNLAENSLTAAGSVSSEDSTMSSSSSLRITSNVELSDVKKNHTRSTDLKHKDSATEIRTVNIRKFSRETSPATSELSAEFMESSSSATTKKKPSPRNSHRVRPSAAEMPSAAEIEEFFSAAEKREQKRFVEKYNYDTVKDVPLEGRYHWIRLKP